jgi:hypothetical protein
LVAYKNVPQLSWPAGHFLFSVGIIVRKTTQERIQILHPAKIQTDGHVLYSTMVLIGAFCRIPWTIRLLPGNLVRRCGEVNIHVGAAEFVHCTLNNTFPSFHNSSSL